MSVWLVAIALLVARDGHAHPGDRYTISLITMSPGDPIFFRFGHNAILVRDSLRRTHQVYNWGTFSFQEEGLITKFLQGRLTYWLSVQPLGPTLAHYDSEHRWLVEQELNLTPEQKLQLVRKIEENARKENREYRYHYYRDNCSTRVRDVLDSVLDGKLKAISHQPATLTYRGQTSRLVADLEWGRFLLNLAMGNYIDQPITEWEELFVPEKVQQMVRKVETVDATGQTVPLVRVERTLVEAPHRKPPPDMPPNRTWSWLIVGLLGGLLFAALGYRLVSYPAEESAKPSVGRRLALAIPLGAWSTVTGFLGLIFVFFWTMTDHEVAYHNENLLQANPLTAAFPVISVGLMLGKPWALRAFKTLAYVVASLSLFGLMAKALPWFTQVNGDSIALFLPVWFGLAAGPIVHQIRNKRIARPKDASAPDSSGGPQDVGTQHSPKA
ncbi:MAG TPA: DUF4105 domain-containing protein [Polyangiaceae bacterium]|nr:DUF4105 domain-containing protein [Polyangiaceae bacterium]